MKSTLATEISEVLESFGLNVRERAVYVALLPLGTTTLTPLATASGLPLTTTQSVVGRLIEHGLIAVSQQKSRHLYTAHDPSVLRTILTRRAEEAATIVPDLRKLMAHEPTTTRVRVYQRQRVTDIFNDALRAKSRLVYEIVAAREFQDLIGEKFHFSRRRVRAGVRLRSLRVASREIKRYGPEINRRELREAKILPTELTFKTSLMWWDDTVAVLPPKNEGLAVTISSPAFRETCQQIFDLLWSVSRQYT